MNELTSDHRAQSTTQNVSIADIVVDKDIMMRDVIDKKTVESYKENLAAILEASPIVVFETPNGLMLVDGFHRLAAARQLNWKQIKVQKYKGSVQDARAFACLANLKHGRPLSQSERKRAVQEYIKLNVELSDRMIADETGSNRNIIGILRKELEDKGEIKSPEKRLGADGRKTTVTTVTVEEPTVSPKETAKEEKVQCANCGAFFVSSSARALGFLYCPKCAPHMREMGPLDRLEANKKEALDEKVQCSWPGCPRFVPVGMAKVIEGKAYCPSCAPLVSVMKKNEAKQNATSSNIETWAEREQRMHSDKSALELAVIQDLKALGWPITMDKEFIVLKAKPSAYVAPPLKVALYFESKDSANTLTEEDKRAREMLERDLKIHVKKVVYGPDTVQERERVIKEIRDYLMKLQDQK